MPQWITRDGQRIGHACWSLLGFRNQKLGHSQVNRICLLTGVHGLIKPQAWRLILWFFNSTWWQTLDWKILFDLTLLNKYIRCWGFLRPSEKWYQTEIWWWWWWLDDVDGDDDDDEEEVDDKDNNNNNNINNYNYNHYSFNKKMQLNMVNIKSVIVNNSARAAHRIKFPPIYYDFYR